MSDSENMPDVAENAQITGRQQHALNPHKTTAYNATDLRQAKFVEGLIAGKSMQQAAIDAGYSENTARSASREIMPRVREIFKRALAARMSVGKLADRIAEGLDAEETKFFQKDGVVMDERNVVAWSERRQYADLAAELMDIKPERGGVNINASGPMQVAVVYASAESLADSEDDG